MPARPNKTIVVSQALKLSKLRRKQRPLKKEEKTSIIFGHARRRVSVTTYALHGNDQAS
jgi:hypothetical protein